jgi:hypothetical protein
LKNEDPFIIWCERFMHFSLLYSIKNLRW